MRAKKIFCWTLIIAGVLLITGCDNDPSKNTKEEASPNSPVSQTEDMKNAAGSSDTAASQPAQKTMQLIIYQADKTAHLIPENHVVPFDDHPAETAIKIMLQGTKHAEHIKVVPAGTQLLGISIKEHIAYVDFNDKLKGITGSASELLLVGAIVNTLTEFPDIHKVQIMINNQKVDTLSGHMDLSQPLERMEQVIQK